MVQGCQRVIDSCFSSGSRLGTSPLFVNNMASGHVVWKKDMIVMIPDVRITDRIAPISPQIEVHAASDTMTMTGERFIDRPIRRGPQKYPQNGSGVFTPEPFFVAVAGPSGDDGALWEPRIEPRSGRKGL